MIHLHMQADLDWKESRPTKTSRKKRQRSRALSQLSDCVNVAHRMYRCVGAIPHMQITLHNHRCKVTRPSNQIQKSNQRYQKDTNTKVSNSHRCLQSVHPPYLLLSYSFFFFFYVNYYNEFYSKLYVLIR